MSLSAAVECLLFASPEPLSTADLSRALGCEEALVSAALADLARRLEMSGSGLQLMEIAGGFQLATRAEYHEFVARLMAQSPPKLSRAALETMAIIAYRQPITQPEIEAVRGVASGSVIKTLLERDLIAEAGRRLTVGRPILYVTTQNFLHYFGLKDLSELPPLDGEDAKDNASPPSSA
ncbi:MAG: SMC-Scp complex subunit ScpB [Chthonomonadales bacterium]